jgi:trimeric autotransporter adhesin
MEERMKRKITVTPVLTSVRFVCLIGVSALFAPVFCRAQGYTISTVAGGGSSIAIPGPATSLLLAPAGVAVDSADNLYISTGEVFNVVYKVSPSGIASIFAGTLNQGGYSGDGFAATSAEPNYPQGLAPDPAGNLYIADWLNGRIRKVSTNGLISTVAGGGAPSANSGNGGTATSAVEFGAYGDVRKVASDGTITTVAGGGYLTLGDGGPATRAWLYGPQDVAVDGAGNLYIADTLNNRIRKVSNGITTVAGGGSGGDNGPATQAALSGPTEVAVDTSGHVYIADTKDQRVRLVTPGGTISTMSAA